MPTSGRPGREVTDHPWLERLARIGLVAYGAVHLLIAWLAFTVAWRINPDAADADQAGHCGRSRSHPAGCALLWVIGLGLLALAVWQAGEVRWWTGLLVPDRRLHAAYICAKCIAKAVVYGALAVVALVFAVGARYDATDSTQDLTDDLLEIPGGAALLVLGGVVVVGVGAYLAWRGWTAGFMKDVDLDAAPDRYEPTIAALGRAAATWPRRSPSPSPAAWWCSPPSPATSRRRPAWTAPSTPSARCRPAVAAHRGGRRVRGVRRLRPGPRPLPRPRPRHLGVRAPSGQQAVNGHRRGLGQGTS